MVTSRDCFPEGRLARIVTVVPFEHSILGQQIPQRMVAHLPSLAGHSRIHIRDTEHPVEIHNFTILNGQAIYQIKSPRLDGILPAWNSTAYGVATLSF